MVIFESAFQFAFEVPQQATDKTVPPVDLVQARQGVRNARFEATKEEFAKGLDTLSISRLLVRLNITVSRVRVRACARCDGKFDQFLRTDKVPVKPIEERVNLYVTELGQSCTRFE